MPKSKFRIIRKYAMKYYNTAGTTYVVQKRILGFWVPVRRFGKREYAEDCFYCLTNPVVKEA